jgi:hypothetical protein
LTTTTVNKDHHRRGSPLTAASINNDCHCHRRQQTMTAGFWQPLLLTVWQRQWLPLTAAIAVIVDSGGGVIESTAW